MKSLLYKYLCHIGHDVGLTKNEIERNWHEMNATNYTIWHIQHLSLEVMKNVDGEGEEDNNTTNNDALEINE